MNRLRSSILFGAARVHNRKAVQLFRDPMNVISTRLPPCIAAPAVQQGVHCAANRSGKCFRRFSIRRLINYRYSVFIVPSLAKSRRSPRHAEISTPRHNLFAFLLPFFPRFEIIAKI